MTRTEDLKREWGIRLRLVREALGLTQDELCALTGPCEKKTYSAWEQGRNRLDIYWLVRLHASCGVTPDYILLGRTGGLPAEVEKKVLQRLCQ